MSGGVGRARSNAFCGDVEFNVALEESLTREEILERCVSTPSDIGKFIINEAIRAKLKGEDIVTICQINIPAFMKLMTFFEVRAKLQGFNIYEIFKFITKVEAASLAAYQDIRNRLSKSEILLIVRGCRFSVAKEILNYSDIYTKACGTNPEKIQLAIKLQALARGKLTRDKFQVKQLRSEQLTDYHLMPLGNDPDEIFTGSSSDKKLALVATSGFRAIEVACLMSSDVTKIPKIYLVDNSNNIHELWLRAKNAFFLMADESDLIVMLRSVVLSMPKYTELFSSGRYSIKRPPKYLDIIGFFNNLVANYGFINVKKIVCNTVVIRGDWTDNCLFTRLNAIIREIGILDICAYPSNIASCVRGEYLQKLVIQSVKSLTPRAAIFTDLCSFHGRPLTAFTYEHVIDEDAVRSDLKLVRVPTATRVARLPMGFSMGAAGVPPTAILAYMLRSGGHFDPPIKLEFHE